MSIRRRRLAAIALVVTAPLTLSACSTSFGAPTNQQYQQGIGANLREGSVQIYNGLFVDNEDGTATFSGAFLAREEDQVITSASVTPSLGAPVPVTLEAPIELAAEDLLPVGSQGKIIVASDAVEAGRYVTLTLGTSSGEVTLDVPVVERTEMYSSVATEPVATAESEDLTPEVEG